MTSQEYQWHQNCECVNRVSVYRGSYLVMPERTATQVTWQVQTGRIDKASETVTAWVAVDISPDAIWRWGMKYNTHSFSPITGRVTNPLINHGVHRDMIDVLVPWCSTWYRVLV